MIIKVAPQTFRILAHLDREGNISAAEAWTIHKCRSLSSRISEIKKLGYSVGKSYRKDITGQRYVRYEFQGLAVPPVSVTDNYGTSVTA